jgi:Tfp pilus assembly protein PilF
MPKRNSLIFPAVLVAVLTAIVYLPVTGYEFVALDDPDYVTGNAVVTQGLSWRGLAWALGSFHAKNWHPVTWVSHMADVSIFGMRAGGHHLGNLLLHAFTTALAYLLLRQLALSSGAALFVAMLFGLHPVHVESVAWIAERKDVLSACFWFLTMLAYVRWVRRGGGGNYLAILVFFALALGAKPMVVTLPLALLILDFWPLGRLRPHGAAPGGRPSPGRLLLEKAPLLAMSFLAGMLTLSAQSSGAFISFEPANAAVSGVRYLLKLLWPVNLAVFYPLPPGGTPLWEAVGGAALLLGISGWAVLQAARRPWVTTGWLWYLLTLAPVIGVVQVGRQAMADRYLYLPSLGLFLVAGLAATELGRSRPAARPWLAGAAALVLALCALGTSRQLRHWRTTEELALHAHAVTSDNWLALSLLAQAADAKGRAAEALRLFEETVRLNPEHAESYNNLGALYAAQGRFAEATLALEAAVRLAPQVPATRFNLGLRYFMNGDMPAALAQHEALRRLDPMLADELMKFLRLRLP